ncbi:unnamed protein product [Prunus armeniaca]|uniref:Uncharacterized protein n=1 Tax=Prunus armeniaca TaxID=36596 RepID=A0A6J5UJP0_PRUAR|nr:unnamed protein product [Prunus armeniaca]
MGCGISKLGANAHQHHQHDHLTTSSACESNNYNIGKDPERGMHDYGEEDDMMMKEKERSGRVEKVVKEGRIKEGHPHAHAHAHAGLGLGKGGRQYSDDDGYDEQMLSSSDREDSFIHCPRSPSFRDYFIDSDQDSSRHHTPNKFFFSGDANDHEINKSETWAESQNTNKQQRISEADELVKKESKGSRPSGIRGVLGKQSRLRSYLNVSNWHHHNSPISSPSQQNPSKLVAAEN